MRDGLIAAVGSSEEIERSLPNDAEVVDATGRAVLPGFVDAHAHPVFAGNRVDEFELRAKGATSSKSRRAEVEFARPFARRGPHRRTSCSRKRRNTPFGFCGREPQQSKQSLAMG